MDYTKLAVGVIASIISEEMVSAQAVGEDVIIIWEDCYDDLGAVIEALIQEDSQTRWQDRVIAEEKELAEKIERLHAFLLSDPQIDDAEAGLLRQQLECMPPYLAVLRKRIKEFSK